jgi:hypothetical protein
MNVFVKTSEKYIRGISPPGRAGGRMKYIFQKRRSFN